MSITVTNISSTYVGFSEETPLRNVYNTFSVVLGLSVFISLLSPNKDGPKAALFRYRFSFPVIFNQGKDAKDLFSPLDIIVSPWRTSF